MVNTFVISDPHFGHTNIIKYCDRPFANAEDMNEKLIENWNNVVSENDLVICGGDFMFYKKDTGIFDRLKGRKILVIGNHDYKATKALAWESMHDIYAFNHMGKHIVICHYPLMSWNHRGHGAIHLYGHVHNSVEDQSIMPNAYNISVEAIGYQPVLLDEFVHMPTFDYQNAKFNIVKNRWIAK